MFHERMKEEMRRLGLKPGDIAKKSESKDSQGIRDALGGRKRLTAEMLVLLGTVGMDIGYIVTGERIDSAITEDEKELIRLFRAAPLVLKAAVIGTLHGGSSVLPNGHSGHHVLIGDVSVGNVSSGQGGVTIGGVVTAAFREG